MAKYAWSNDNEWFYNVCDTIDDCISEAKVIGEKRIYIGIVEDVKIDLEVLKKSCLFNYDNIFDEISEISGVNQYNYSDFVPVSDAKALSNILCETLYKWMVETKNIPIPFKVHSIKSYQLGEVFIMESDI